MATQIRVGKYAATRPTWAHAVEAFLATHSRTQAWSAGTVMKYRQTLTGLAAGMTGSPVCRSVAALDTPAGTAALHAAFVGAYGPLAPATRARHLAALRSALGWWRTVGWLVGDPTLGWARPKISRDAGQPPPQDARPDPVSRDAGWPPACAGLPPQANVRSMEPRLSLAELNSDLYRRMAALNSAVQNCGLEHQLLELIKMRASQVNGCAYCLDMHSKDAHAMGETEQRLYALNAWRETPFYTERERAALALTETITLITDGHVPDAVYAEARRVFDEKEVGKHQ